MPICLAAHLPNHFMAGLPKIALARLKANPGAPKSSSPAWGPDDFQGAGHPDANLLAAFVEKTLTKPERTQVLNHLSQCAECREVAAFILPTEDALAEPARVPAWRRWNPWLVLRWGAMAAALGVVTVVVVLHPGMWNRHTEMAKVTSPPVPAGNIKSAPQAVPAPPLAQPSPELGQAKVQGEARASADELAAAGKPSKHHPELTRDDHIARAKSKPQVTLIASARPPTAFRAENVPAANVERVEGKKGSTLTAVALPAPSPPAPAAAPTAASDEQEKLKVGSQANAEPFHTTAPSVEAVGASPGGSSAEAAPAKAASRVSAGGALRMAAPAPMGQMQASRKDKELGVGPPATLWSVSSDGKVQRSTDSGKTFEPIHVARGIKFRAIASLGNDVWTGGTRGSLFHSADGGATWSRAGISLDGNTLMETITSIQLRTPQHLTVTTDSGSQWVSEDGGQTWQKQP